MRLGLNLGYSGARFELNIDLVKQAEEIGFDSVWTAEAYGSDAVTPLAWIGARTLPRSGVEKSLVETPWLSTMRSPNSCSVCFKKIVPAPPLFSPDPPCAWVPWRSNASASP